MNSYTSIFKIPDLESMKIFNFLIGLVYKLLFLYILLYNFTMFINKMNWNFHIFWANVNKILVCIKSKLGMVAFVLLHIVFFFFFFFFF